MCKKFKSGGLLRGARDAAFIIVQVFFSFWIIAIRPLAFAPSTLTDSAPRIK